MDIISTNIKDRILKVAEYKGISKEKFIESINQKYANYKGVSKKSSPSADVLAEISTKYNDINLEWLLTGKGEILKSSGSSHLIASESTLSYGNKDDQATSIPLIPVEAMAGFGNGHTSQIMEYDAERYVIPEFSELNVEFLIRMKGSSMLPKYNSGDLLGCRRLPMDTFFQWNKVYVIDTIQGALVKRIQKSDRPGYITCVSDNNNYPPFDLNYDADVNAIAIVLGVIRLE